MNSIYKAISDIQNAYTYRISYIINHSIPKILFIKDTNEIKYIYDEYTQYCIDKITEECNKKIKEIIDGSTIEGRLTSSRRFASNEF